LNVKLRFWRSAVAAFEPAVLLLTLKFVYVQLRVDPAGNVYGKVVPDGQASVTVAPLRPPAVMRSLTLLMIASVVAVGGRGLPLTAGFTTLIVPLTRN
jgi:hypothetical protein